MKVHRHRPHMDQVAAQITQTTRPLFEQTKCLQIVTLYALNVTGKYSFIVIAFVIVMESQLFTLRIFIARIMKRIS